MTRRRVAPRPWDVHGSWLSEHPELAAKHVADMKEAAYTGMLASALLLPGRGREAVLRGLLPRRARHLAVAEVDYMSVPTNGLDIVVGMTDGQRRSAVLVEHKRGGPVHAQRYAALEKRAPRHPTCQSNATCKLKSGQTMGDPGLWQLDASVCFDDWRPPDLARVPVAARVFLDGLDRNAVAVYPGLHHPTAWTSVGYASFARSLRGSYDQDAEARAVLAPLLMALYAW